MSQTAKPEIVDVPNGPPSVTTFRWVHPVLSQGGELSGRRRGGTIGGGLGVGGTIGVDFVGVGTDLSLGAIRRAYFNFVNAEFRRGGE